MPLPIYKVSPKDTADCLEFPRNEVESLESPELLAEAPQLYYQT